VRPLPTGSLPGIHARNPGARRRWRVLPSLLLVLAFPATASAETPTPTETPAPVLTPEPEAAPTVSAPDLRPADDPSRTVEDHVEVLAAARRSARLVVSKGCVKTATVGGSGIRSVAFTLDGRTLRTVKRTSARLGRPSAARTGWWPTSASPTASAGR